MIVGMEMANLVGWMMLMAAISLANAQGKKRPKSVDFSKPFELDEHAVILFYFDEGKGGQSYDDSDDPLVSKRLSKQCHHDSRCHVCPAGVGV